MAGDHNDPLISQRVPLMTLLAPGERLRICGHLIIIIIIVIDYIIIVAIIKILATLSFQMIARPVTWLMVLCALGTHRRKGARLRYIIIIIIINIIINDFDFSNSVFRQLGAHVNYC